MKVTEFLPFCGFYGLHTSDEKITVPSSYIKYVRYLKVTYWQHSRAQYHKIISDAIRT